MVSGSGPCIVESYPHLDSRSPATVLGAGHEQLIARLLSSATAAAPSWRAIAPGWLMVSPVRRLLTCTLSFGSLNVKRAPAACACQTAPELVQEIPNLLPYLNRVLNRETDARIGTLACVLKGDHGTSSGLGVKAKLLGHAGGHRRGNEQHVQKAH